MVALEIRRHLAEVISRVEEHALVSHKVMTSASRNRLRLNEKNTGRVSSHGSGHENVAWLRYDDPKCVLLTKSVS